MDRVKRMEEMGMGKWRWWRKVGYLLVPVLVVWWWVAQPKRFRLVTTITIPENSQVLKSDPADLYLRLDVPDKLTLFGWDGKPRWQVPVKAKHLCADKIPDSPDAGTGELADAGYALSPDGHVLAIALRSSKQLRVITWRDGRMLGEVHLHLSNRLDQLAYCFEAKLQATDSGRVWLFDAQPSATYIHGSSPLIAIDGSHIAYGYYAMSPIPPAETYNNWELSPDGTKLYCENLLGTLELVSLQVHAERIIATCRFATTTSYPPNFEWQNSEWLTNSDGDGSMLGPNGVVQGAKDYYFLTPTFRYSMGNHCQVFLPPPAHPWQVPTAGIIKAGICSMDGQAALLLEQSAPRKSNMQRMLRNLPLLNRLVDQEAYRFALYTHPGRPRAVLNSDFEGDLEDDRALYFTLSGTIYRIDDLSLSPDGRRVAILVKVYKGKSAGSKELHLFTW